MKNFWLLLFLSFALGTTCAWTMNYVQFGHRDAFLGEIDYAGAVTADNAMDKLSEYYSDSSAKAEVVGDTTFDFEAMPPGSQGEHEFTIKNVGSEPLTLELGATTCKCTLSELENNELAPGESTKIKLEWTVSSSKKEFSQSAEVRTNDPVNPAIQLKVVGQVISSIEFDPEKIFFGQVPAGEDFTVYTKMYSYMDEKIEPVDGLFGSKDLTALADFEITEVDVTEADATHKRARQAFEVKAYVKPGMRQGSIVTDLRVAFHKLDESGKAIVDPDAENEQEGGTLWTASTECAGRIIGALSMIESSKLRPTSATGGYIWTLGRLGPDDNLEYKAFVVLKGSEVNSTNLTIGETYPSERVQAEIGDPIVKKSTRLYPITLKLTANDEMADLLGKNKDDFAWLWIESDNPKVSRMRVAVKVLIEPRP